MTFSLIFLLAAVILFFVAAFISTSKINLVAAGLGFWSLSVLLTSGILS